jgi:hypothetical protein
MPAQPGTSKVFPNVAGARKPIGGKRVFVLRALDNMKRLGKTPRGPGVIEVQTKVCHRYSGVIDYGFSSLTVGLP